MTEFELCRELNKLGFPQKRCDDSWYWLTPELLIKMEDVDSLYLSDKRTTPSYADHLIYYPTIEDFIDHLQEDLQSVSQTVASGWFAYAGSHIAGATLRSGGTSPWLALANVVYAQYLAKTQPNPFDAMASENVQEPKESTV